MRLTMSLPRRTGRELPPLIELLKREKARYKDFMVGAAPESGGLRMVLAPYVDEKGIGESPGLAFDIDGRTYVMALTNPAHAQLCEKTLNVSKGYEKIAKDQPHNLPPIVNHYLRQQEGRKLVRAYELSEDGKGNHAIVRAILSDSYRILDHKDVALTALEGAKIATDEMGAPPPFVREWEVSETRFSLALWTPTIWADFEAGVPRIHRGTETLPDAVREFIGDFGPGSERLPMNRQGGKDIVFAGFRVQNSETGDARLTVSVDGFRIHCFNGAMGSKALALVHIGRKAGEEALLRPETIARDNALTFQKVRDAVAASFSAERFEELVRAIHDLKAIETKKAAAVAAVIVERTGLGEDAEKRLLAAYEQVGTHPTAFDVYQTVTAMRGDAQSEDEADALERVAAELTQKDLTLLRAIRA